MKSNTPKQPNFTLRITVLLFLLFLSSRPTKSQNPVSNSRHSSKFLLPDTIFAVWNGGGGDWSVATNWDCGNGQHCVPDSSTQATINGGPVTLDIAGQAQTVFINGAGLSAAGTSLNVGQGLSNSSTVSLDQGALFTMNGFTNSGTTTLTNNSSLLAGTSLTLDGGSVVLDKSTLSTSGQLSMSDGTLTVQDSGNLTTTGAGLGEGSTGNSASVTVNGSKWNAGSGTLQLGIVAAGSLNVGSGGSVTAGGGYLGGASIASGTANVSGGGQWTNQGTLTVGSGGVGSLTVGSGSLVSDTGATLSDNTGSTGNATVTGGQWQNTGPVTVGNLGTANLTIQQGGVVTGTVGEIASGAGIIGIAKVSGPGSQWNLSSALTVGGGGKGGLGIGSGATVVSQGASIASAVGSYGEVQMGGTGTTWNIKGNFTVGDFGNGTRGKYAGGNVSADNHAIVFTSGDAMIANQAGSLGTAAFNTGAQWQIGGSLTVGGSGDGTLNVPPGGGFVSTGKDAIIAANSGAHGTVNVSGTMSQWKITGNLRVGETGKGLLNILNGAAVNTGGDVIFANVSNSGGIATVGPGSLWNVNGNYTQQQCPKTCASGLYLQIAGTNLGTYGQLNIKGTGTFGEIIVIQFVKNFAPKTGNSWTLINVPSGSGFLKSNIFIQGLQTGFKCSTTYSNGQFVLTALSDGQPGNATQHCS